MPEQLRKFSLRDVFPQSLSIRIRGPDVLLLEEHAPPHEEAPFPDLAELFVEAVNLGMMAGAVVEPWASQAKVVSKTADLATQTQSWLLQVKGLEPGSFRVLSNLFAARELTEVLVATEATHDSRAQMTPILGISALAYPRPYAKLPFELQVEPPLRVSKDRSIQIVFQRAPADEIVDRLIGAFGLWTNLVLLGAYPRQDMAPRESGGIPDDAFLLDEFTVEQAFSEAFFADDAAFHAMVNHALQIHRTGALISSVLIR